MNKQSLLAAIIAIMAAAFVAYLVLNDVRCSDGTVSYDSGPVKTCVLSHQSAFLACLGQVKSSYSRDAGSAESAKLDLAVGDLTVELDVQGNKVVVPEKSTIDSNAALYQVKACGRANGVRVEPSVGVSGDGQNVGTNISGSQNTGVIIDNSRTQSAQAPAPSAPSD